MSAYSHFDVIVNQVDLQREIMKKYIDDYADSILKKVKLNQEQAIEKIKLIPVDENVKPIRTEVDNIRQMVEASEIEPDDLKHKASELSLKLDERLHMAKNISAIYDCHGFSPSCIIKAYNIHDYFGQTTHKPKTVSIFH